MKYIIVALVAWTLLILVSGLIYYLTAHHFDYPEFWIRAIIKCKGDK